MFLSSIPVEIQVNVKKGMVIPAVPLALKKDRQLDERFQRGLVRYYLDAGAGGIAVGVHTTQFAIRDPQIDLLGPVLNTVSNAVDEWCALNRRSILTIAGVCGKSDQARREALLARRTGFHACLLSLADFKDDNLPTILQHCREIATILPLVGFYLQTAVGGRSLPYAFWREFAEIENVLAIKIAPFNRYQTLDVIRAVCEAGRENDIALYTGNDDQIVFDLLTRYQVQTSFGLRETRIVGGLLGHWAVWTKKAVELLETIHETLETGPAIPESLLSLAAQITDANGAIFDAAHQFAGCIPGIHYVLHRQGLLPGIWCLDPNEVLSAGQVEEIERVIAAYPEQADDDFVRSNLNSWLS
jgi:dihydrodipicolinate synthase/N-acetylneuraminate lyase